MTAPVTQPIPTPAGLPVRTLIYDEVSSWMTAGYVYTDPVADTGWPTITEYDPEHTGERFPPHWGDEPTERDAAARRGPGRYSPDTPHVEGINILDYAHTAAQRGWGAGWPSCAVTSSRSGVRLSVHKRIARLVSMLLEQTEGPLGYGLKIGQCGAFNCRPIAGTNTASNHSWGLAADLNWQDNPYTTTTKHTMPTPVARLWNRYGFAWGGDYTGGKRDYMHLEFMGTPGDADAMTTQAQTELGQPGEVLAALSNDQLIAMITAVYQFVSGSAAVVPQGQPWPGWPTWPGGSNQKLTATDYLREANVQLTKLQADVAAIKKALKIP
jgi:hypothetical protein